MPGPRSGAVPHGCSAAQSSLVAATNHKARASSAAWCIQGRYSRATRSSQPASDGIQLHGFLNGSIDLTLRQQIDGSTRYSVVDYKTNNLAPGIASPLLAHYRRPRLLQAMADNQYALQALIYSVALHRYLGWRLADYDPAVHLGPVGYLFVRGMVGAGTPTETVGDHTYRAGVFSWQVPHELVVAMSALFAGDRELTST